MLGLLSDGLPRNQRHVKVSFGVSSRTANRVLDDVLANGWISRQGRACARAYVLTLRGRVDMRIDMASYLRCPSVERALATAVNLSTRW